MPMNINNDKQQFKFQLVFFSAVKEFCVCSAWRSVRLMVRGSCVSVVRGGGGHVTGAVGRPRSELSLERKEDLEKRLESMSGCLTGRGGRGAAKTHSSGAAAGRGGLPAGAGPAGVGGGATSRLSDTSTESTDSDTSASDTSD